MSSDLVFQAAPRQAGAAVGSPLKEIPSSCTASYIQLPQHIKNLVAELEQANDRGDTARMLEIGRMLKSHSDPRQRYKTGYAFLDKKLASEPNFS